MGTVISPLPGFLLSLEAFRWGSEIPDLGYSWSNCRDIDLLMVDDELIGSKPF